MLYITHMTCFTYLMTFTGSSRRQRLHWCVVRFAHGPGDDRTCASHAVYREEVGDWGVFLTQRAEHVLSEETAKYGQCWGERLPSV